MRGLYNYGISQEDERTEAAALGLPGGRVLSIASGGDMALSLLALGADNVVAVDIEPAQLHLARLKLSAVLGLERLEAIRFCSGSCRRPPTGACDRSPRSWTASLPRPGSRRPDRRRAQGPYLGGTLRAPPR